MSDGGISRRDLVRRGGYVAAAGASLFGLAGCARRDQTASASGAGGATTHAATSASRCPRT